MIVHVLNLNLVAYQLNFSVIRIYIRLYKDAISENEKPFFLLYGQTNEEIIDKYNEIYDELNWTDFCYCTTRKELHKFIRNYRTNPYLLHGMTYKGIFEMITSSAKNLNWVCWGAGTRINYKNWKSVVFTPVKYWLYHHFRTTIVLLKGDKQTLERYFGMKNIIMLPYYMEKHERMQNVYDSLRNISKNSSKPVVYLGNSGNCMDSYFELLNRLERFAGKIELHCMLQYMAPPVAKRKDELISLGTRLFGKDFCPDITYMAPESYLQYMNRCDVYICGAKEQSGLGAIGVCLTLGKKIYITGKNYTHIMGQSYKVFELSELDDNFCIPLSEEDSYRNYKLQYAILEPIKKQWLGYLRTL